MAEIDLGALGTPGAVILGKYRVERVIGVGGMGAVVAATHLQLDERVAIKCLLGSMRNDPDVVQRFLREGRASIKIRSEHCVRVLDVGTLEDGAPYMVMEYLEGSDLAGVLEREGRLATARAVDYVLQGAEALAEAHARGIVHRDIKPANLFLTQAADGSPTIKVLDFGISKQTGGGAGLAMTGTAALLGSPLYMSPEQLKSTRDVDARTDVWSLSAVLYELLAGSPPFTGETLALLCVQILERPPAPLTRARPDVPPGLDAALMRGLEKDRSRRFADVGEFSAAIAPFGSEVAAFSAAKIARLLGRQARPLQMSTPDLLAAAATTGALPGTSTTTAQTLPAPSAAQSSSLRMVWAGGALVTLVLFGAGGALYAWSARAAHGPARAAAVAETGHDPTAVIAPLPPPSPVDPSRTNPNTPAASNPSSVPAGSPSTVPVAVAPAESARPPATKPAAAAPPRGKATAPKPAAPGAKPAGGLFDDRNE